MLDRRSKHLPIAPNIRNLGAAAGLSLAAIVGFAISLAGPVRAADNIEGQVLGAGAPIAKSTVTLWSAGTDAPKQLAQTQTGDDGRFTLSAGEAGSRDNSLYIAAKGGVPTANKDGGDNRAIVLLAVLGSTPPAKVTINELTTVASVWTMTSSSTAPRSGHARTAHRRRQRTQFRRPLETGGYGATIADALNSTADADPGQFRHAGERAGRGANKSQGRCVRRLVRGCHRARRQSAHRHAGGGGIHRPCSLAPARKSLRLAGEASILFRRARPRCGRRPSCPI